MHSDWPRGVFAWGYVNMVVTSKRCFAFQALISKAQIWKKKFLSWKIDKFTLLYPFPSWLKLGQSLQTCCTVIFFFFLLELTFQARKIHILERIFFCKTRTDNTCKTLCTRLHDWNKNFPFNQWYDKESCVFSGESYM